MSKGVKITTNMPNKSDLCVDLVPNSSANKQPNALSLLLPLVATSRKMQRQSPQLFRNIPAGKNRLCLFSLSFNFSSRFHKRRA